MKLQMTELVWADGLLLAEPFGPPFVMQGVTDHIAYWRPTWGGKVLGVFERDVRTLGIDLQDNRFRWPAVPVSQLSGRDVWYTGTVDFFIEQIEYDVWEYCRCLRPEHNMRKSTNGTERISRKIAHRVIWADRTSGHFITDPLYRKTFALYGDALDYLRERERVQRERMERVDAEAPF